MSTKPKAIILLSPFYLDNPDHRIKLIDFCRKDFALIKIVQAKNRHNFKDLKKVIKAAISWKDNITVIIDKETFDLSDNMLTCTVLGTLSLAKMANILLYQKSYIEDQNNIDIKFKFISGKENQGLHLAIHHFRAISACINEQKIKLSKTKQAVILMQQPYWYSNKEVQARLVGLCDENDLSVIRIIKSKNKFDSSIFYRLIDLIQQHQHRPITVIMEEQEYRSIDNILNCSIVGALLLFGVIDLAIYKENTSIKLQLEFIKSDDMDFFKIAQMNIFQLMDFRQKQLEKRSS